MFLRFWFAISLILVVQCGAALAQVSPALATAPPDPKVILTQSLAAAGAAGVQGFSAQGTTTYYWGGKQVQALTTVLGLGRDQFRMDASVPGGTRTVSVSHTSGTRKDASGKLTTIPMHNTFGTVVQTFPYMAIASALSDSTAQITYIGLVQSDSSSLYQVRVTRVLPTDNDPRGIVAQLSPVDYFIDSQTLLVVKTADIIHPIQTFTQSFPRETDLESYTTVNGVAVPNLVREKISGNTTWEFDLSSITFNPNLSDSDFAVQ